MKIQTVLQVFWFLPDETVLYIKGFCRNLQKPFTFYTEFKVLI